MLVKADLEEEDDDDDDDDDELSKLESDLMDSDEMNQGMGVREQNERLR